MLTAWMFALLGYAREYSDLINIPSINTIGTNTNTINLRVSKAVPPRWIGGRKKESLGYGVEERGPALQGIAEAMGLPYSYTRDRRPEEYRPVMSITHNGDPGLRGSYMDKQGTPNRRRVVNRRGF